MRANLVRLALRRPAAGRLPPRIKPDLIRTRSLTQDTLPSIRYNWIDGVEQIELYEKGGYHPVVIDEVMNNRYTIVDKLGFGTYSTVWVARDEIRQTLVALKVGIARPSQAQREPGVLRALSATPSLTTRTVHAYGDLVANILDDFEIQGPNGTHRCHTMKLMQGDLRTASFSCLFTIRVARALAAKLVLAVDHVHSRGFVHGGTCFLDIRLSNMLINAPSTISKLSISEFRARFDEPCMEPVSRVDKGPLPLGMPARVAIALDLSKEAEDFTMDDARGLVLCDFGEAFAPATEQRLGRACNIPVAKRPPEAAFRPDQDLSYSSDVWSLGLAIWEILGMNALFTESEPFNEVIAQQIEVLGIQSFPAGWRALFDGPEATDTDPLIPRQPAHKREPWPPLEHAFEEFVQKYRRKWDDLGVFGEQETHLIFDLMRKMLRFRPEERLTTQEILKSEWMVKWALPELEKS